MNATVKGECKSIKKMVERKYICLWLQESAITPSNLHHDLMLTNWHYSPSPWTNQGLCTDPRGKQRWFDLR